MASNPKVIVVLRSMVVLLQPFVASLVIHGASSVQAGPLQVEIVDDRFGAFIDISPTGPTPGTRLGMGDDAEVVVATIIDNLVFPAGDVVVANNGGLGFRNPPSTDLPPVNGPISSGFAFGGGQAALAFADDIGDIDDKDDRDVFVLETPNALIVQWNNKTFGANQTLGPLPPSSATFQIQIFDGANQIGDIVAQFIYEDIEQAFPGGPGGGASATIGYQDGGAGFGDFQWSFNDPVVSNGTVLSLVLVPEPSTLIVMSLGVLGLMGWRRGRITRPGFCQ